MNISSIIIKTLSKNRKQCEENLSKINGVEVALSKDATIIATIEANSTNEEVAILKEIENTQYVISAAMHYTYFEDELRDEIANMNDDIANILNDDSVPIEKMQYSGSVHSMMKKNK